MSVEFFCVSKHNFKVAKMQIHKIEHLTLKNNQKYLVASQLLHFFSTKSKGKLQLSFLSEQTIQK
jgi:hypothetical protein